MFFILECKNGKRFVQLGIVVADSVEEASTKISIQIVSVVRPPETRFIFAALAGDRYLSEMPEITKFADISRTPLLDAEITREANKKVFDDKNSVRRTTEDLCGN